MFDKIYIYIFTYLCRKSVETYGMLIVHSKKYIHGVHSHSAAIIKDNNCLCLARLFTINLVC